MHWRYIFQKNQLYLEKRVVPQLTEKNSILVNFPQSLDKKACYFHNKNKIGDWLFGCYYLQRPHLPLTPEAPAAPPLPEEYWCIHRRQIPRKCHNIAHYYYPIVG